MAQSYISTSGYGEARFQCHINTSCKATKYNAKQRALYQASKKAHASCVNSYGGEYRPEVISNGITCRGWTSGNCAGYVSMRCIVPQPQTTPKFSCNLKVPASTDDSNYRLLKCQKLTKCFDDLFESNLSQNEKLKEKQKLSKFVDRYSCRDFPDFRD